MLKEIENLKINFEKQQESKEVQYNDFIESLKEKYENIKSDALKTQEDVYLEKIENIKKNLENDLNKKYEKNLNNEYQKYNSLVKQMTKLQSECRLMEENNKNIEKNHETLLQNKINEYLNEINILKDKNKKIQLTLLDTNEILLNYKNKYQQLQLDIKNDQKKLEESKQKNLNLSNEFSQQNQLNLEKISHFELKLKQKEQAIINLEKVSISYQNNNKLLLDDINLLKNQKISNINQIKLITEQLNHSNQKINHLNNEIKILNLKNNNQYINRNDIIPYFFQILQYSNLDANFIQKISNMLSLTNDEIDHLKKLIFEKNKKDEKLSDLWLEFLLNETKEQKEKENVDDALLNNKK